MSWGWDSGDILYTVYVVGFVCELHRNTRWNDRIADFQIWKKEVLDCEQCWHEVDKSCILWEYQIIHMSCNQQARVFHFPIQQTTAPWSRYTYENALDINNHHKIASTYHPQPPSPSHITLLSYFFSSTACSAILLNSVTNVLPTSVTSWRILPQYWLV